MIENELLVTFVTRRQTKYMDFLSFLCYVHPSQMKFLYVPTLFYKSQGPWIDNRYFILIKNVIKFAKNTVKIKWLSLLAPSPISLSISLSLFFLFFLSLLSHTPGFISRGSLSGPSIMTPEEQKTSLNPIVSLFSFSQQLCPGSEMQM